MTERVADTRVVEVPTEDGRMCVMEFTHEERPLWWTVRISDELIAMSPEAVHAVLGQALMQMREES